MHLVYSIDEHPTNWQWWSKIHSFLSVFPGRLSFKQVWGSKSFKASFFPSSVWKSFVAWHLVTASCNFYVITSTLIIVAVFVPFDPAMAFQRVWELFSYLLYTFFFFKLLYGRSFCKGRVTQLWFMWQNHCYCCSHIAKTLIWLPNQMVMNGAISSDY